MGALKPTCLYVSRKNHCKDPSLTPVRISSRAGPSESLATSTCHTQPNIEKKCIHFPQTSMTCVPSCFYLINIYFFFSLFGCVSACVWRGNYVLATDWLSTDERWTEILTDWHYLPTLFTVRENQKYTFRFDVYEVYLRPANKAGHLKSQREK